MFTSIIGFSSGRVLAEVPISFSLAIYLLVCMILITIGILSSCYCRKDSKDKPKYEDDYHYGADGSSYGHSDI